MKRTIIHSVLVFLALVLLYLEVRYGSIEMSNSDFWKRLTTNDPVLWSFRIPAALTAALAGACLGLSGWLLQTLFRNPLAGPSILGITSGSSLMVALVLLAGFSFTGVFSSLGLVAAALIGSFGVLALILVVSARVKQLATVLIFGLMISYLLGAFQSILIDTAGKSELKSFVSWGLASFGNYREGQLWMLAGALLLGIITVLKLGSKLDFWLLGEDYARSLGVNVKSFRMVLLAVCGVLAGVVTAYCGPVAFLGLAMPHAVRLFYQEPNHIRFVGVLVLTGASAGMLCELLSRMPWSSTVLPLNAVTSFLGAPVVIWLLVKSRQMKTSH
ncbi:MAG: FecCD family ABC transporter permease [Flavobacteriales bacterium]